MKEYKRHWLVSARILCFSILLSMGSFFLSFASTMENQIERDFWRYIAPLILILGGFLLFQFRRSYVIIITDEFIAMKEYGVKIGKWRFPDFLSIQIRWEDIIAIYLINYFFRKAAFIIPKPNPEDFNNVEMLTSEVKFNRKGKIAKLYIDWLKLNRKTIHIYPDTNRYKELIKEIIIRTPQAVVDEKIKKWLEK